MSEFTDMMIDDGFSDEQEDMDYLESQADDFYRGQLDRDFDNNDYQDYDDYDYSEEGCGEGYSCSQCDNYGCPSHPCN